MAHYIDKDTLVAELDKLYDLEYNNTSDLSCGKKIVLRNILLFLDTLEVKEVDLEKEIDKFYGMYRKDGKTFLLEDNEECVDWKIDCNPKFEISFAKHFFELGVKAAQKGE